MSTDRLKIYNGALLICGERSLATLSDNIEPRYLLDEVWNDDGVRHCLEKGQWNFAMRTQKLEYDPSIEPDFGYRRAFQKPADWISTCAVCSDEFFRVPLLQYTQEAGYWFANLDEIYVKFVSDDNEYGGDYSLWPSSFIDYVKAYFASRIVLKLTNAADRATAILGADMSGEKRGILYANLLNAKNRDAQGEPTKFPAQGSWSSARMGRRGGRGPMGDGGSSSSLIG